jgi:SRSO17 transposase
VMLAFAMMAAIRHRATQKLNARRELRPAG